VPQETLSLRQETLQEMYFTAGVKLHKPLGKEAKSWCQPLVNMFASLVHKVNINVKSYLGFSLLAISNRAGCLRTLALGISQTRQQVTCLHSPVLPPHLKSRYLCQLQHLYSAQRYTFIKWFLILRRAILQETEMDVRSSFSRKEAFSGSKERQVPDKCIALTLKSGQI